MGLENRIVKKNLVTFFVCHKTTHGGILIISYHLRLIISK